MLYKKLLSQTPFSLVRDSGKARGLKSSEEMTVEKPGGL